MGIPSKIYPYHFSIYECLEGKSLNLLRLDQSSKENLAFDLANFLKEFQNINLDGPEPGAHNWWRGDHINVYDKGFREQLAQLIDIIDFDVAINLLGLALNIKWNKEPVLVHGDIAIGNIFLKDNKLSAIIDFGCMAKGDPACDLVITWTYFSGKARDIFVNQINLDEENLFRARACVLWKATFEFCQIKNKNSFAGLDQKKIIDDILLS